MSPALMSSRSFVFAAAMAVSGTVIFLSFSRTRPFPAFHLPENQPPLRSCLYSDERRRERMKNKKKRVTFSEEVKVMEVARSRPSIKKLGVRRDMKLRRTTTEKPCKDEILAVDHTMPANRVALYHGIF